MSSKFKGHYVEIIPTGITHLHFNKTGNHYSWRHINTFIYGILIGKVWLNIQGEFDILNHKTKDVAQMKFHPPPSYFVKETQNKVTGIIKDANSIAKYMIEGSCTEKVECSTVLNPQKITSFDEIKKLTLSTPTLLWKRVMPP